MLQFVETNPSGEVNPSYRRDVLNIDEPDVPQPEGGEDDARDVYNHSPQSPTKEAGSPQGEDFSHHESGSPFESPEEKKKRKKKKKPRKKKKSAQPAAKDDWNEADEQAQAAFERLRAEGHQLDVKAGVAAALGPGAQKKGLPRPCRPGETPEDVLDPTGSKRRPIGLAEIRSIRTLASEPDLDTKFIEDCLQSVYVVMDQTTEQAVQTVVQALVTNTLPPHLAIKDPRPQRTMAEIESASMKAEQAMMHKMIGNAACRRGDMSQEQIQELLEQVTAVTQVGFFLFFCDFQEDNAEVAPFFVHFIKK